MEFTDALAIFALLVGLELVLGIDNVLVIAILVERLPEEKRDRARVIGLAVAMIARVVLLFVLIALSQLTEPLLGPFSVRDLILIAGGMFLLYKAVKEIRHTVELTDEKAAASGKGGKATFASVITQIVILDVVFSVDSVITAIGLTGELWIIVTAVIVSFVAVLAFAKPVGDFIMRNPTLKILALSFLITIGVTIFMEGFHQEVPKGYIYLPMGFALFVELLQMRYEHNRKKLDGGGAGADGGAGG